MNANGTDLGQQPVIACVDVCYGENTATAACLVFEQWSDESPTSILIKHFDNVAPYQPGEFFRRELPCILGILQDVTQPIHTIIVDGYVYLSKDGRPGLGARLYESLKQKVTVIGVAKTAFLGSDYAVQVRRGDSSRPLYITAAGVSPDQAAKLVASMAGPHRLPKLLKQVDVLCRQKHTNSS